MLTIARAEADSPDALALMAELSSKLTEITGDSGAISFDVSEMQASNACFLLVRNFAGEAVGCGAFRWLAANIAEIKRMYVRDAGKGTGGKLLRELENQARQQGYRQLWLETRRVNQHAVEFYLAQGYQVRENYGRYRGNLLAVCFEKML
ncbi:GNAT family N-acetyltransferase [Pseudomonas lundensis]|uniref:GNAT family N-acetyltransferase n=1 Tax=Serratia proteamaculans TaxID=28151 RepID=UPI002981BEF6|nr:GNAT family N-acetyltransferase [Serratia proteamaculans]MDW5500906.1 GNAT family N-acetyltransferase [Serratia proteamaculans]MDW5505970.1 GNAT family N-acetyltransferase [Pseudomonas lundensis]